MSDLEKPSYVALLESARAAVSAHEAVVQGIATHAEKHQAARQAADHKAEMTAKLNAGTQAINA